MKKLLIPFMLLFVLILSACGDSSSDKKDSTSKEKESDTITYQSEDGPVEVPANPKRVVVLGSYTGDLLQLGVPLAGVDTWAKNNPNFKNALKDVAEVSEENVEQIIELDPDLIIGLSTAKNLDKIKKIAPTVTFTYNKVNYLQQHIEIGKLVNKEKEATAWVDDFKKRAEEAGKEIKAKIGEDATVSVVESFDKQLYVFGDSWGRGTEVLYQAIQLKMPEKIKEMTAKDGYYDISAEVLPEYAGDYIILSKFSEADNSFQNTDTYKNIPAVKNNHVYSFDANTFFLNDATTLELQLDFFKKVFLGE